MDQLSIYDSRGAQDPAEYAVAALTWIDQSWGSWWRLVDMCEQEAGNPSRIVYKMDEHGNIELSEDGEPAVDHIVRIRRGDLYMLAQMHGMRISLCNEFRFDNNVWPALSRFMLMVRPKTSAVIHPAYNPDGIDSLDLAQMWRDFKWSHPGRAALFFPASRWQDAAEMAAVGDVSAA